jgi:hypothetical protein
MIKVDWNEDQEPTFYATNNSLTPFTVYVEFYNLKNTLPPSPNPVVRTVKPGTTKITKLKKSGLVDGSVNYRYRYSYKPGCFDTKPKDLEYLLPVKEGNQTMINTLFYVGEIVGKKSPEDYYGLIFSAENGDMIYTARGGTVIQVEQDYENNELDNYYSKNYNFVRILHDDCTIASYRQLKKGTIVVKPGDKINAGDRIAEVVPRKNEKPGFRLFITYLNPDHGTTEDESYNKYVVPKFRTGSLENIELQTANNYFSVHPTKLITQEMGWFEKRRWKRKNN